MKQLKNLDEALEMNIGNITVKRNFFRYFVVLEDVLISKKYSEDYFSAKEVSAQLRWKSIFGEIKLLKVTVFDAKLQKIHNDDTYDQLRNFFTRKTDDKIEFASDFYILFMNSFLNDQFLGNIKVKAVHQGINLSLNIDKLNEIATLEFAGECCAVFDVKFTNVNHLKKIANIFLRSNVDFFNSNLNISGNLNVDLSEEIPKLEGRIINTNGSYIFNDNKFEIKSAQYRLLYLNNLLLLNFADLKFENATFNGEIQYINDSLMIDGNLVDVDVQTAKKIWPEELNPKLRKWITDNTLSGQFLSSNVLLDTKKSFLELNDVKFNKVNFSLPIGDDQQKLLILNASGSFNFKDGKFDLLMENGYLDGYAESKLMFSCTQNSKTDDYEMHLNGNAKGDLKKSYDVMSKFIKPFFSDFKITEGLLDANFAFNININKHAENFNIKKEVKVNFYNLQTRVMDLFDFEAKDINIAISDDGIKINSKGALLNNLGVFFNAKYDFNTDYMYANLDGNFSLDNIKKISLLNKTHIFNNDAYGKFKIIKNKDDISLEGIMDLHQNNLDLSYLLAPGDNKLSDSTLKLNFTFNNNNKFTKIHYVSIQGPGIDIRTSGALGPNLMELKSENFIVNNNKLSFQYKVLNDRKFINIKGGYLNLSNFKLDDINQNDGFNKINSFLNFRKVLLKNDVTIESAILDFNDNIIGSVFTASFQNGQYISAKVDQFGFDIISNNAGYLLNGLDITDSVTGGELNFHLDINNLLRTKPGMLIINRFFVTKASALAQVLSLASFTGLLDALNGDGIRFNKVIAPIKYADGILYFDESWAEGTALGISFKGPVNLIDEEMILYGTIVPIYKLNKLIWKIPVIGKMITGGKSRGIMAASYTIKKHDGKTTVNVDTLSTLTPTILQKVFEIFK